MRSRWIGRMVGVGLLVGAVLLASASPGSWLPRRLEAAAIAPNLGAAQSYAVLAAAGVTNTGATTVAGDLGTHPTAAVTGFFGSTANEGPGTVSGTIHQADAAALAARTAL